MSSSPKPEDALSRSLNNQEVLDEDEYTAALSRIIARDFFPSLVHLDATNHYLDAMSSQNPDLINASVRRLQELSTPAASARIPYQTPFQTPYGYGAGPSETPLRTPRGEPTAKRARYDTDLSLDAFQARYTSEDNSSFTQILEDENRKRREKWAWAWDAQRRVEGQQKKMLERRERMMIEGAKEAGVREKVLIEPPELPKGLIEAAPEGEVRAESSDEVDNGKGKELAVRTPQEEEQTVDVMAPKKDTRAAGVDGWKFKTRNALMFPPDADVSPYTPRTSSQDSNARTIEPKVVKYANTRLPEQEDGSSITRGRSEPPSPTRSRIDAAIAGTPYRPKSPTINNFSLVPAMPSPTPSELGPAAVKQLMTWGSLNATPRILSQTGDDDVPPPSTPFHISGPSAREQLSHKLSSKAAKSLKAKAELLGDKSLFGGIRQKGISGKGTMPPPNWTPRRAEARGSLTPAAKRLLDRTTLGTAATRRAEAMARINGWEGSSATKGKDVDRVRWTPTPSPVTRR
ncbi:hypothetical protein PUNSTDRAFT_58453 [Punctularia strigosozonata HHB-11173 SS5]|uniref:uncharacterized protein n=1 Tax=Punctularia strigosozonata (strain HHB-11173) TaxID=741275 RepID=UPI0004417EEA|nr:uncharacterized protein PUNSTDRAFT_58453 [Punctularia strigosozonata HHB-11173 SS5]EIN14177.1 hypothetical protein PUNSTDRAFT_58453 [Punctularia strigosozonata HHB-11173 SS5]